MKRLLGIAAILARITLATTTVLGFGILRPAAGQAAEHAPERQDSARPEPPPATQSKEATPGRQYSGMYSFLKEGEFVQLTVEDDGHVTGFISRFGDGESDKGAFLDQFFKTGKLAGNKLIFTTDVVHAVWFDFDGTVERGEGKNPQDEAYYVLKGRLTESSSDVNKKVTSKSQEVLLKRFPEGSK
jgi:hypothetical protein